MKNKLLTISCDSFTFQSAFKEADERSLEFAISGFMEYISDDKNKVSKQDLKQLAKNVSIQDDPVKII